MKKHTIKLLSRPLTQNYSYIGYDNGILSETAIMNKIIEFSQGKNIKIYKHIVRNEWIENTKKYGYKTHFTNGKPLDKPIPKGDEVFYLDIYYQDK